MGSVGAVTGTGTTEGARELGPWPAAAGCCAAVDCLWIVPV